MLGHGLVLTNRPTLLRSFIHSLLNTKSRRVSHPPRFLSKSFDGDMKRKATDSSIQTKTKRPREPEADYCDVTPRNDDLGNAVWPASEQSIGLAREFLKEW